MHLDHERPVLLKNEILILINYKVMKFGIESMNFIKDQMNHSKVSKRLSSASKKTLQTFVCWSIEKKIIDPKIIAVKNASFRANVY